MDKEYWRLKKREQRAKAGGKPPEKLAVATELPILVEWDSDRYPVRKAWEIAVDRAQRARNYAKKFPQFIRESDLKFQNVEWQYENEGLKAVKKKETVLVP